MPAAISVGFSNHAHELLEVTLGKYRLNTPLEWGAYARIVVVSERCGTKPGNLGCCQRPC